MDATAEAAQNVPANNRRAALSMTTCRTSESGSFTFQMEIDNNAGIGMVVGSVLGFGLAAFYYIGERNVREIIGALWRALSGPGQEVGDIRPGSLLVDLHCHTAKSFLEFLADYEAGKVKERLKEELSKIGIDVEHLTVKINNLKEAEEHRLSLVSTESSVEEPIELETNEDKDNSTSERTEEGSSDYERRIDTQILKAEKLERLCSGDAQKEAKSLKISLIENKELVGKILQEKKDAVVDIKKKQTAADYIATDYEDDPKKIAQLVGLIFSLDGKNSTLQKEVQATKTELKEMRDTLSTGEIAFAFERDLALYVYPTNKKFGYVNIFKTMKKWLDEKEKYPQGKEANKKWKDLQEKVSWSSEHEDILKKLKQLRIGLVHPRLNLETAKSQIPGDFFNAEEKKCIGDIIDITKEVNDRMEEAE